MSVGPLILTCLLIAFQDSSLKVVDFVDLPGNWGNKENGTWYIEFRETWIVHQGKGGIIKVVDSYIPHNHIDPEASTDSLQSLFAACIREETSVKGMINLGNISYEFILLDPQARRLQGELIGLITWRSPAAKHYNLEQQMLSVHFHEVWFINPVSLQFKKKVRGITPVIWQRRMTTDGEPINDADTGLPVYYKNRLERIELRNL
ncbi:MAG: hypothetical protein KAR19_19225 [Bacteroidales bacterium]|nr:hypothetical protein [Bacteroidales bacterium]